MENKKDEEVQALWFDWLKTEKKFTAGQIQTLIEKIKEFNAGAVDKYLTKHVDDAFNQWVNDNK